MSDPKPTSQLSIDEIVARVHALQEQIVEREEQITELIDFDEASSRLETLAEEGEERRRVHHLERLVGDWDRLVARSRAVSEDDIDLVAALVRLVGDLLVIQPDGLDTKWVSRLEMHIEDQRRKVS